MVVLKGDHLAFYSQMYAFVVDAENGQLICSSESPDNLSSVNWSPDGTRIASDSGSWEEPRVRLWNASSGDLLLIHDNAILGGWSPDGTRIASFSGSAVQIWDATTGRTLLVHPTRYYPVCWSPDLQKYIVSGDGRIQIWDATTGKVIHTYRNVQHYAFGAAWSPDGTRIASFVTEREYIGKEEVHVWDATTGRRLFILNGRWDSVWNVIWSPDGMLIALIPNSLSNSIEIWDAIAGKLIRSYFGHRKLVTAVGWSPDGMRIASGDFSGTVHVWTAKRGGTTIYLPRSQTTDSDVRMVAGWHTHRLRGF
jgi:WD40 repeat protein